MPTTGGSTRRFGSLRSVTGPWAGFLGQYVRVVLPYWKAERNWRTRGLAAAFVLLTAALVAIVIGINFWNAGLFNALEQRSFTKFYVLLGLFAALLAANMAVNALHLLVRRRLQIEWRQWLTHQILGSWLNAGRHYQLTLFPGEHDNPDGRIAEDLRITVEGAIDLTHSLLYNVLQLISFVDILWTLSGTVSIQLSGMTIAIPGHMVSIAFVYALVGSALALVIGHPLVGATNLRQSEEANFRFGLVRTRENSEAIALIHGEADERRRLDDLLVSVRAAWRLQTIGLAQIQMFTTAYGMLATTFPLIIASPRYIMGLITLGALMQTAQAFQMVTSSLSWPVDNLSRLAEWRASAGRILSLRASLDALEYENAAASANRIDIAMGERAEIVMTDLRIADPKSAPRMAPVTATIKPGDHVLVGGDPELIERLPRVLAQLWPWGQGRVVLPDAAIFFAPEQPYLPIGPLLGAVCYPSRPEACDLAGVTDALRRVGLGHLVPRQTEQATWEHELTREERQRLGLARLLIHRPRWIVVQDAMSALCEDDKRAMLAVFASEFKSTAVIHIGDHAPFREFYPRKILLVRDQPQASPADATGPADTTPPARPAPAGTG